MSRWRDALAGALAGAALGCGVACASATFSNYTDACWTVIAYDVEFDCDNWSFKTAGVYINRKHASCPDPKKFRWKAGVDWDAGGGPDGKIDKTIGPQICIKPTLPMHTGVLQGDASCAKKKKGQFISEWAFWTDGNGSAPIAADFAHQPFDGTKS